MDVDFFPDDALALVRGLPLDGDDHDGWHMWCDAADGIVAERGFVSALGSVCFFARLVAGQAAAMTGLSVDDVFNVVREAVAEMLDEARTGDDSPPS